MSGRRRLMLLLLGAISLCCFGWARESALRLESMGDLQLLALEEAFSLSGRAARNMLDQEAQEAFPISFAVWKELDAQGLQNPELERFAPVTALLIAGNSEMVFASDIPLDAGDPDGCLIDSLTAQSLFGSEYPLHGQVQWNGRELTVRGILKSERPLLLVQCEETDQDLDHVSLRLSEDGPLKNQVLAEFTARHGLVGQWDDHSASLALFFSLLPGLSLFAPVLIKSMKTTLASDEYPVVFLICLLAAGAVWFLGIWSMELSLKIPTQALPGKWSDFEFWGQLLEAKKEEFFHWLSSPKTQTELARLVPTLSAIGAGVLGSGLALGSLVRIRPQSGLELWLCCAGTIALCFLLSLWLGSPLARDRALWTAPLLFFPVQYAVDRLEDWAGEITGQSTI